MKRAFHSTKGFILEVSPLDESLTRGHIANLPPQQEACIQQISRQLCWNCACLQSRNPDCVQGLPASDWPSLHGMSPLISHNPKPRSTHTHMYMFVTAAVGSLEEMQAPPSNGQTGTGWRPTASNLKGRHPCQRTCCLTHTLGWKGQTAYGRLWKSISLTIFLQQTDQQECISIVQACRHTPGRPCVSCDLS